MKLDASSPIPQSYTRNNTDRSRVEQDQSGSFDDALKAESQNDQKAHDVDAVDKADAAENQNEPVKDETVEAKQPSEEKAKGENKDKTESEDLELNLSEADLDQADGENVDVKVTNEIKDSSLKDASKIGVAEVKDVTEIAKPKSAQLQDDILSADIQKKSNSGRQVAEDAVPDRKALEKLLNSEEINGKTVETQKDGSKVTVDNVTAKDSGVANTKTEVKTNINSSSANTQLANDQGANARVVDNVSGKQNKVNVDPQRMAAVKDQFTFGVDKEIRIGEVKFDRVPTTGLNQIIIQTVANEGRVNPVVTQTLMPENLPTQMNKTLTIQLHPENLGTVEVKITSVNGQLNVAVETSTQAAEKLLKTEMSSLADKFAASGISSDEISVRVNPSLEFSRDSSSQDRQNNMNQGQFAEGELSRSRDDESQGDFMGQDEFRQSGQNGEEADQPVYNIEQNIERREGIYI